MQGNTEGNSNNNTEKGVQERLLDAAEELFCEHGFEGTHVRDIAAVTGCNIAAVNYYFGGKEKLYLEVWRRQLGVMRDIRLASIEKVMSQGGEPQLEQLLRSFANAFIQPLLDKNKGIQIGKLMAREMIDRRLPEDMFVQEFVVPTFTALRGALLSICPGLDESKILLIILSFVGQLMQTLHIKAMFGQTSKPEILQFDLAEAIDHIVKFSAVGIRAYAGEKTV